MLVEVSFAKFLFNAIGEDDALGGEEGKKTSSIRDDDADGEENVGGLDGVVCGSVDR